MKNNEYKQNDMKAILKCKLALQRTYFFANMLICPCS